MRCFVYCSREFRSIANVAMQFLNDPLCWRASQVDSLLPVLHFAVLHELVITVRFGSSLDQNPVLLAVSLELLTRTWEGGSSV